MGPGSMDDANECFNEAACNTGGTPMELANPIRPLCELLQ